MEAEGRGLTGGPRVVSPSGTNRTVSAVSVEEAIGIWTKQPLAWDDIMKSPDPGPNKTNIVSESWMRYVNENFKLIGISVKEPPDQSEAIITDKKEKRTIFLKTGQSTPVQGVPVKLEAIESEHIRLTDGKDGIDIK
jgi:hypothetical protein